MKMPLMLGGIIMFLYVGVCVCVCVENGRFLVFSSTEQCIRVKEISKCKLPLDIFLDF